MSNKVKIKDNKKVEVTINPEAVLADVQTKLGYDMIKDILVKPLETPMITRTFTEIVKVEPEVIDETTGFPKTESREVTKEVESNFRKGVVIKLYEGYNGPVKEGDIVVYPHKFSIDFDLFKDSVLVKPFDIIARGNK